METNKLRVGLTMKRNDGNDGNEGQMRGEDKILTDAFDHLTTI